MKKFFVFLLALVMLVSLCACSLEDDIRGEISTNPTPSTDTTEHTSTEPEFSLGQTANNTYTSEFLGLSCTLSSDWRFYTDEEILQMNNISGEFMDEDLKEALKNATVIYDMAAINDQTYSNINVNLEKLTVLQAATLDIPAVLKSQFPSIKTAFANMGYSDITVESTTVTVDGKEFAGAKLTAKINGIDFYQIIFSFQKGLYMANVSVACAETDETEAILGCFRVS